MYVNHPPLEAYHIRHPSLGRGPPVSPTTCAHLELHSRLGRDAAARDRDPLSCMTEALEACIPHSEVVVTFSDPNSSPLPLVHLVGVDVVSILPVLEEEHSSCVFWVLVLAIPCEGEALNIVLQVVMTKQLPRASNGADIPDLVAVHQRGHQQGLPHGRSAVLHAHDPPVSGSGVVDDLRWQLPGETSVQVQVPRVDPEGIPVPKIGHRPYRHRP